jgi:glycerol-3-phosphate O-acyltransferase
MQFVKRIAHWLGDVLVSEGKSAILLSYFRNVLHPVATPAWIACCFLTTGRSGARRRAPGTAGLSVHPVELFCRGTGAVH